MAFHAPELPPNKLYHLFVCYEKTSIDVVRCIVDNLEKNGFICCFYERDFIPGQSILQNISEAILKSSNMLIVLSEEFENSIYCMHEVEEAVNLKIREEYSLIPIKAEPCSVPERLRHLVYIDVEDDIEGAHDKIIDAIAKKELRDELKAERNGEYMQFDMTPHKLGILSYRRFRLKFTESQRAEIWRNNFEVPAELLQDIEDTVNGSLYMKYLHIWRHPYWNISIIFLFLLIMVIIIFLILFITTSGREKADSYQPARYALAIGLPFVCLSWIVSELVCLTQDVCRIGLFGVQVKSILNRGFLHICGGVFLMMRETAVLDDDSKRISLFIAFLTKALLQVYFTRHLEEREALKKYRRENETNEECTCRLFAEYLSQGCENLLTVSTQKRHEMTNDAKCVCLLVEEWLQTCS